MINRHTTFFVKDLKPIEFCGKPVMWQMDINGAFEKPFETQPTEGEHDFNTCEGCQKTLKELIKRLTEKFEGSHKDGAKPFPFCCTHHSELTTLKEFNRADFVGVPEMVARKIIYTNSHIKNNHQSETYYKDITDYIDYTVESFGQMPGNAEPLYLSDYFFYITDLLERNTEVEKGRKNRLLEFLKAYRTPTETPKTDFNILLGTYQKWLKVFPFEISFFATLKPHLEKQLPLLNGKPETNKYTGIAKAKMHTKGSLIDVLLNLTNNLLTQINTTTLYEKGLLTEPQKIKLELVLNERKMKLKQGYVNSSKDEEQRYRKILKEWFADEKRFIDEVTPIVKALPPQPIVESPFSVLEWATIFYYADETKLLTESRLIKTRLEQFMNKHKINTTFDNFKTKYYEAKKRINEKKDYPISKLELIIPFLKENYKQTVAKVENDIFFLEENKPEY
jgi:hypothetical protein